MTAVIQGDFASETEPGERLKGYHSAGTKRGGSMIYLVAIAAAIAMQDGFEDRIKAAGEALEKAQREYRMSLVELGPDAIPALEKHAQKPEVKQAIDEILRLKEPIEKLVAQLGADEIADRDRALAELVRMGRPARPYLAKVVDHKDAEVRTQVQSLLSRGVQAELDDIRSRERLEIAQLRVKEVGEEVERGKATTRSLIKVRRDLVVMQRQARRIAKRECLESIRDLAARELELVEREWSNGMVGAVEVAKVRLNLLYADVRLGKDVAAELKKATDEASSQVRLLVSRGMISQLEALDQLLQLFTDPFTNLD